MLKSYSYKNLSQEELSLIIQRNIDPLQEIENTVREILSEVYFRKDAALKEFSLKYDKVSPENLILQKEDIEELIYKVPRERMRAIEIAFSNIHRFHNIQMKKERKIETMPGVTCWRENRPIEKVGLYIPGGTAILPSTLLMLGIPARIAGCKEIIVCTPPNAQGSISPSIAYCLHMLKIEKVYLVGGAQAIAAMAYGTESIPKVDKIFGPGNQYVTKAKSLIQQMTQVSIDMPAGPSEVLIIADNTADPGFVAADLLAQAEHGSDSQAILVSNNEKLINEVNRELEIQIKNIPRAEFAINALENSYSLLVDSVDDALLFSNLYAPEHLILAIEDWEQVYRKVLNAGSVFCGHYSPESVGDYASGTNHTLPTSGYARSYSGVSVDSFVKKVTFQHLTKEGIEQIGSVVEILADMENLTAHKEAVSIRLRSLKDMN